MRVIVVERAMISTTATSSNHPSVIVVLVEYISYRNRPYGQC